MSKKLKAIICALTASMMMVTSTGLIAFADEPAAGTENVNTAEATAAPAETTEAVEATVAPTQAASAPNYNDDTYYQNALQVVSALGIITGYDDGSVKPESTVTRAEMATIILRMLATNGDSTYKDVFADVASSHWAANTIQTAVELGILDGMGDGTFLPDGNVKYEQVLKMMVCAMNYGTDAENQGGYPNGYVSVAGSTLKLLTSVNGLVGKDMERGEVIKAVYNALLASYRTISSFDNGYPVYKATDTLGVEKFNMYEEEGILTTTSDMTIAAGAEMKDGMVTIEGVDYKCDLKADQYIGTKIKFYYIDDKADDNKIIAMFSMGKTTEQTFDADDVDSINTTASVPSVKVYTSKTSTSTKSYKIENATVIYNGTILSQADYSKYIGGSDYDGFITPHVGTVKIVDYDNDGTYDIVFVNKYETMLVTNATSEKLTGKIDNASTTIDYDLDDSAYTINVKKSDVDASVKNLKKNDVASIMRNVEGTTINIVVTGESITGEVTSVGEDDDDTTITVNGQVYKVDKNCLETVKSGITGTFYLDMFNRVGYIDSNGTLSASEKYAMITKAFYNDENELVVRLFTQEGTEIEAKPAGSINAWLPGATSNSKPTEEQLYTALNNDSKYIQCTVGSADHPMKLCKYTLNSAGEISKLYVAVDKDSVSDSNALTIYSGNLRGVSALGGTVAGYSIEDGITEFSVPDKTTEANSGSNYSVGTVTASSYKNYDGGVSIDYMIGDFLNSKYPQVLVKFTTSSTSMYDIDEIDTASISSKMLVSKINEAADAEGETIYQLVGYANGAEVSYYTTQQTSLFKYTGWNTTDRKYTGSILFNATGDKNGGTTDLPSVLRAGDIITLSANGANIKTMVKMVDVNDVATLAISQKMPDGMVDLSNGSSASGTTRETYYVGLIGSVDIEDSAFIGVRNIDNSGSSTLTYDSSTSFTYVTLTVNETGKITKTKVNKTETIEPGELSVFGEDDSTVDFGLFTSLKGNMSSGYIVRVEFE